MDIFFLEEFTKENRVQLKRTQTLNYCNETWAKLAFKIGGGAYFENGRFCINGVDGSNNEFIQ